MRSSEEAQGMSKEKDEFQMTVWFMLKNLMQPSLKGKSQLIAPYNNNSTPGIST